MPALVKGLIWGLGLERFGWVDALTVGGMACGSFCASVLKLPPSCML